MTRDLVTIERITHIDEPTFRQIRAELEEHDWNWESTCAFVSDANNFLVIARMEGRAVGALMAHSLARLDAPRPHVLLYEIDVHPAVQKRGVGTAMIENLKKLARHVSASEIWVVTNKSNRAAMQLYRAAGGEAKQDDDVVFDFRL